MTVLHHCPGLRSGNRLLGNCKKRVKIPSSITNRAVYYCPEHQTYCKKHPKVAFLKVEECVTCVGEANATELAKANKKKEQDEAKKATIDAKVAADKKKKSDNEAKSRLETAKRALERKKLLIGFDGK